MSTRAFVILGAVLVAVIAMAWLWWGSWQAAAVSATVGAAYWCIVTIARETDRRRRATR